MRRPANPITSSQVEVVASSAGSLIGLVFGAQAIPPLISQWDSMASPLGLVIVTAVFGSLVLMGLAALFRQWTAPIFGVVAAVYLITLIVWPLVVPPLATGDVPWIYYLCNVATGAAVVAAPSRWPYALFYTIAACGILGVLRTLPSGGDAGEFRAGLDALYCFLIGLVMLVIVVALRQAARSVDQAQGYALESYAGAVRHNATENERVRVDALVHDNVLITLLSAARARTPETKALATRMARNAIEHLTEAQTTFPVAREDLTMDELLGRLRIAVAEQRRGFDVHAHTVRDARVPSVAADALVEAATQAMVNSVNHAEVAGRSTARELRVRVRWGEPPQIVVEISDDGPGFDLAAVPAERLGVRRSILGRMERAGGRAEIESAPGRGTSVRLLWPAQHVEDDLDRPPAPEPAALDIVGKSGGDWS